MVQDVWITRTLLDSHASVHPGTLVNAVKLPLTNAHPIPARMGLRALMASTMWHALVQKALKVYCWLMRPVHRDHFENGHYFLCFILPSTRKKMHFIWVSKYFARKHYLGSLFFVSNWRRDRHFTWSSEPREGLPACSAKELPSFLSYFKTLSIGRAPGIDLATSRSTIKRYCDWANPPR